MKWIMYVIDNSNLGLAQSDLRFNCKYPWVMQNLEELAARSDICYNLQFSDTIKLQRAVYVNSN